MDTRPKIKLNLSPLDNTLELAAKILFVMMWGVTVFAYIKLPSTIPVHYNASGQADNYGSRTALLLVAFLGSLIYFGLTQLNKYPHRFNFLTKITVDNAKRQYTIATRLLRFLKLAVLIIFSLIVIFTYLTTIGVKNGLGVWVLPLTLLLLSLPIILSIRESLSDEKDLVG